MRMLFGDRSIRGESTFIKEINEENIDFENKPKAEIPVINKVDKFYEGDVDYKVGDRVYHNDFGEGIVINVDKSIMSVSFAYPHQVKKLLKNHKSIKKI
jgi:GTP1/Obg family GTP-binding protein